MRDIHPANDLASSKVQFWPVQVIKKTVPIRRRQKGQQEGKELKSRLKTQILAGRGLEKMCVVAIAERIVGVGVPGEDRAG